MKYLSWALILALVCPVKAAYCIITTISYHRSTSGGIEVGQATYMTCFTGGGGEGGVSTTGGGGSTSTGGGSTSTGGTTGTTQTVTNSAEFVNCLNQVVSYSNTYGFGLPTANGPHQGIDLFTGNGTEVLSPCDGVIERFVDNVPRNSNITNGGNPEGNYLRITPDHSFDRDGNLIPGAALIVTLGHLDPGFSQDFGIGVRRRVTRGMRIARSDNTGSTNVGPHLHLQITNSEGENLDPEKIINCN